MIPQFKINRKLTLKSCASPKEATFLDTIFRSGQIEEKTRVLPRLQNQVKTKELPLL